MKHPHSKMLISCFAKSWKSTMIRYDVQFYACLLAFLWNVDLHSPTNIKILTRVFILIWRKIFLCKNFIVFSNQPSQSQSSKASQRARNKNQSSENIERYLWRSACLEANSSQVELLCWVVQSENSAIPKCLGCFLKTNWNSGKKFSSKLKAKSFQT